MILGCDGDGVNHLCLHILCQTLIDQYIYIYAYIYGSGHRSVAVLLPGFAIK